MKRCLSLILIVFMASPIIAVRPFGPFFGQGGAGFTPSTIRHQTGTGTENIPAGSAQVTVEGWAGGGGGNVGTPVTHPKGGSSGSYGKRVFTITSADWGKGIAWSVGNGGAGCGPSGICSGTDGQNTTIGSVVINGVTLNMVMNKGLHSGSAPSAGTGGTTNTAGNAAVGTIAGAARVGDDADAAGAGGDGTSRDDTDPPDSSFGGDNGMVKFKFE